MIMTSLIVKILIFQLIISILIIKISKRLNLLDIPNTRKVHKFLVPYTGGIIISFTFLFVVYITNFNIDYLNLILSTSFLIAISGFIDDRYNSFNAVGNENKYQPFFTINNSINI